MRYYDIDFLARIAAGKRLDEAGMKRLRTHMAENDETVESVVRRYSPPPG